MMPTSYLVDVMANVSKIRLNTRETKTFGAFVKDFFSYVQNISKDASRVDQFFYLYIERTIKDSERLKRGQSAAVELNKVEKDTPLPLQMESIWPLSKKKAFLEGLTHENAMLFPQNDYIADIFVSAFNKTDGNGYHSFKLASGQVIDVPDLNPGLKGADLIMILHAFNAAQIRAESNRLLFSHKAQVF